MNELADASTGAGRTRAVVWRGVGWITAAALALLSLCRWLSATSVGYLLLAATATAIAFALVFMTSAADRRWALACAITLSLGVVLAANTQTQVARLSRDWDAERQHVADEAISTLTGEVARAGERLHVLARDALVAPSDRSAAFASLANAGTSSHESIVLYRGDSAYAWAGQPHVPTDSLVRPVGVSGTAFYLALFATATSGTQRAVATRLLYAIPPADRLAPSLATDVAARAGVAGFEFVPVSDSAAMIGGHVVRVGGGALFVARPLLLTQGEVQLRVLERGRLLVGLL